MKCYAGIGSRKTPKNIQKKMTAIAEALSNLGYCLRSGGATGADTAFENGAKAKQIFLPWDGFNGKREDGLEYIVPEFDMTLVNKFHPKPENLSKEGRLFMSRNSNQVLGANLNDPSEFIVCWTPEGRMLGGTSQALRIANSMRLPIFNLGSPTGSADLKTFLMANKFFG